MLVVILSHNPKRHAFSLKLKAVLVARKFCFWYTACRIGAIPCTVYTTSESKGRRSIIRTIHTNTFWVAITTSFPINARRTFII